MTVGKRSRVLDPFFELALMDTTPDLALPSKEGALAISPAKCKHGYLVGSRNKPIEGTRLRKIAYGGKCYVPKPLSASRKLQLQLRAIDAAMGIDDWSGHVCGFEEWNDDRDIPLGSTAHGLGAAISAHR
ncbi:hypothetical protein M0R45_009231 [Rubus argutus]|uniref:Uncharacterized protein n=1 Tax=Rubus argutus TaxID=59490 RepID=A0AAW1Y3B9_RUBAR